MLSPDQILHDFILFDHRLGDHPNVKATVFLRHSSPRWVSAYQTHETPLGSVLAPGLWYARNSVKSTRIKPDGVFGNRSAAAFYSSMVAYPIHADNLLVGVLGVSSGQEDLRRVEDKIALLTALLGFALAPETVQIYPGPTPLRLTDALRVIRTGMGLSKQETEQQADVPVNTVARLEQGFIHPRDDDLILRVCKGLGVISTHRTLVQVVSANSVLPRLICNDPRLLNSLTPDQFERFIAERLDRMGFDVSLTGSTYAKDGGVDLIAVPKLRSVGSFLLAGQVKHHRSGRSVGRPDVDRLLAWRGSPFSLGLLVTNTTFSPDGRWLAEQATNRSFLRLRDFEDLKRWIADDFGSEHDWREIPSEIELAPGVIVPIPRPSIPNYRKLWPDFGALS